MADFSREKKIQLSRSDHSKKGSIDEEIAHVVDLINSFDDLYTTSSCSGRITLFVEPSTGKKCDSEWLYTTHGSTDIMQIKDCLRVIPKERIWLRMEPFIIHVCAKDLEAAKRFLETANGCGLKHSGIISLRKRIIVEALSSDHMDTLVAKDGRMLFSDDILEAFISEAERKMAKNRKRIDAFHHALESLLPETQQENISDSLQ